MAPFDRQIYGAEQITHVEPIVEPQIQNMAKAGSRAPTSPDDEGEPASLEGLDDDTVLIVTSFLPECRDVLSLSVTRALPETAWRVLHSLEVPHGRGIDQVRRNLPEFSLPDVHGGQPPRQLPIPWKN